MYKTICFAFKCIFSYLPLAPEVVLINADPWYWSFEEARVERGADSEEDLYEAGYWSGVTLQAEIMTNNFP